MAGVQSGIQNCNNLIFTGVAGFLRQITANSRHTVFEFHLIYRLNQLINLRYIGILYARQILDRFQICIVCLHRQTVEHCRIFIAHLCVVHCGVHFAFHSLAGAHQLAFRRLCGATVQKIRCAGILRYAMVVQQWCIFQFDHDTDTVVRGIGILADQLTAVRTEQAGVVRICRHRSGWRAGKQQYRRKCSRSPPPQ